MSFTPLLMMQQEPLLRRACGPTEVGEAYRELIMGHVFKYGIPAAFYSDRHSIFKPTTSGPLTSEDQDGTQYQAHLQ